MVKIKKRYFVYLIYLIMVTLIVTAVSFSRYATTLESSDQVSVAKPVIVYEPVSATLNGDTIADISAGIAITDLLPGDELIYNFHIHNFQGVEPNVELNQVFLKYMINVTFNPSTTTLPLTYTIQPAELYPSAGGDWTYLYYGTQVTHSYTLTVSWDEADNGAIYKDKQQIIQIQIDAEQADF